MQQWFGNTFDPIFKSIQYQDICKLYLSYTFVVNLIPATCWETAKNTSTGNNLNFSMCSMCSLHSRKFDFIPGSSPEFQWLPLSTSTKRLFSVYPLKHLNTKTARFQWEPQCNWATCVVVKMPAVHPVPWIVERSKESEAARKKKHRMLLDFSGITALKKNVRGRKYTLEKHCQ